MGQPVGTQKRKYTVAEYFTLREETLHRYEYERGDLIMMGRTFDVHNELVTNSMIAIKSVVKGRGCKVYTESISVEVEEENCYYLPDVVLTCDDRDHQDRKIKRHPSLIVEVLSKGTAHRDRGDKFLAYLKIPSLHYYLLIAQDRIRVEVYSKLAESKGWQFQLYESLDARIPLPHLNIELNVANIYEEVELLEQENEPDDLDLLNSPSAPID